MGTMTVVLQESEATAKIDADEKVVMVEPDNRLLGFGVALKLDEAIQFARMILEVEAMLAEETPGASEGVQAF